MIGLYIDKLAEQGLWCAIDRVLEAQLWTTEVFAARHGARCLRGHAEDFHRLTAKDEAARQVGRSFLNPAYEGVGRRFDRLVERFGMDRVVKAIKARCGRHTAVRLPSPAPLEASLNV